MKLQHLICALLCVFLVSCGDDGCKATGLVVIPANATADHNAASPGNTIQFFAHAVVPGSCVTSSAALLLPDWSVSDTVNVSISSAKDGTNGIAICLHATAGSVTVTATSPKSPTQNFTATAKLTCN
jgi:hypothetical protein